MRFGGKARQSRRLRWPQILLLVLALPVLLFIWIDMNLKPVILSMAEAKARVMAVEAVNNAAYEVMRERISYSDLVVVVLDEAGRVAMLQADTMRMNELGTRTALVAQRNLDALAATGIRIPIGSATGSRLLAGSGPSVTVNLVPMGSVTAEFVSEFTSAGINQTRHRIYLKMNTMVRMVIPTGAGQAQVSAYVPIAESIIVGQVPQTFIDTLSDQRISLVPVH
jgi:sporulation protein YunB